MGRGDADNQAITALEARRNGAGDVEVFARVRNFGDAQATVPPHSALRATTPTSSVRRSPLASPHRDLSRRRDGHSRECRLDGLCLDAHEFVERAFHPLVDALELVPKEPAEEAEREEDRDRSGPSFPSGHVTNNTVIALCLMFFYRRGWLYWIIAAAIGYSRIYLGAHWPSDVIATFFLAAGETLLILAGLEWLWRWGAPKWAPQLYARHPGLIVGQVFNLPDSQVENLRHNE